MRCLKCNSENKEDSKFCRKCKAEMDPAVELWRPSWKWHAKVLTGIYIILLIVFFSMNYILKPYMRQIPKDITPWLKDIPKTEPIG